MDVTLGDLAYKIPYGQARDLLYFIGRELGCEDNGFKVIVGSGEANRTLIGKALNRRIELVAKFHKP